MPLRPKLGRTSISRMCKQYETLSQTTKPTGPAEALSATHRSEAAMPSRSSASGSGWASSGGSVDGGNIVAVSHSIISIRGRSLSSPRRMRSMRNGGQLARARIVARSQ